LGTKYPTSNSFNKPEEGIYKISMNPNHFKSLDVVSSLNDCLSNPHFFTIDAHYSTVFNEYLNYAKKPGHIMGGEHSIQKTKIDFIIEDTNGPNSYNHTYVERKSPLGYMSDLRKKCTQYICLDDKWHSSRTCVYGITDVGLNMEFSEVRLGNKGLMGIAPNINYNNCEVETYSFVSNIKFDTIPIEGKDLFGEDLMGNFTLFKEVGSLDKPDDIDFIKECRLYQIK
jgi:hypothetical protein